MTNDAVSALRRESQALVHSLDRHPLVGAVIRGDSSRDEYVRFLRCTYHYVRWSGPLLAATAAGLRRNGRYAWLTDTVLAKAEEESPHDRWVLEDLRRCGANPELVKASAAPAAVQVYVDWSLAMAEAGSPAFLGYAYALEFISMSRAHVAAENLRARAAIPNIANALSFLVGHGIADPGHVALLEEVLCRIEDPEDQGAILLSASMLRILYPRFFRLAPQAIPQPDDWAA
jgi:hypothetical protein